MPLPLVDLHAHSNESDGALSPTALVALAAERRIEVLALTDHDTVRGLNEARTAGTRLGVRVIAGIEISAKHPHGQCHLLAWLPDPVPAAFLAWTETKSRERRERAQAMVDRLRALGLPIEWEDVEREARGNVGRPHVADALVARAAVASRREAFETLIGEGGPAYIPSGKIEPAEAIRVATGAGGLVCLAHPYSLHLDEDALDREVAALAAAGLGAIEAHRADQSPDQQAAYVALAHRHGLLVSTGSDFHALEREDERRLGSGGAPGIADHDLAALLSRLPGAP